MTPDELLLLHPRETVRWLRGRLGLTPKDFAKRAVVQQLTVATWEAGLAPIRRVETRRRLAALLAPQLATPEGVAFTQSLAEQEGPPR